MTQSREHPRVPRPSLWPVGFALGVVVFLLGFVISPWIVGLGAVVALSFGLLWGRESAAARGLDVGAEIEPERRVAEVAEAALDLEPAHEPPSYTREKFLGAATAGLGSVIGGLVMVPSLGFMVLPSFLNQGSDDHDLGPLDRFPEEEWRIATFPTDPDAGDVSRLTVFIRNNGRVEGQPSFTILSSHCVHLGCPVQPNAVPPVETTEYRDVTLSPTEPSGFGCPCHGGQYDNEGNRTAGPPVRALDRFAFSVRHGNLFIGKPFSVSTVEGTGAGAKIHRWRYAFPGVHVDGVESWLYPIQPPS